MKRPQYDADKIWSDLLTMDRNPFRSELSKLLECAPDEETLKAFSHKYPEKWANSLKVLAGLSGYHDKEVSTQVNIYTQINTLSDSALLLELQNTLIQIGQSQILEGVAVDNNSINDVPENAVFTDVS